MSRKGDMPIVLPKSVEVTYSNGVVTVKSPKGTLSQKMLDGIDVKQEDGHLFVLMDMSRRDELNKFHGLSWALINNMIEGLTKGFEKKLEMIGVGYRAAVQGNTLDLQVGCSHPTKLPIPAGIKVQVEKNSLISITGVNKQAVGQFAAEVRSKRPPEPYQGKGIRYDGEHVRRKAGKAAKTAKA